MTFSFIPLGVGDAFSTRYYSSCLYVSVDDFGILIDCPHPIRKMLHETAMDPTPDVGDVDAVAITHLHADHVSGLEGFLFFARFHLNRRVVLAAHEDVLSELWPRHLSVGMDTLCFEGKRKTFSLTEYADTRSLDESASTTVGPLEISCRRTIHHIPTYALKLSAGGITLGYSADTSYDPGLIDWLDDSTVIVHETNVGIHTSYEELNSLPAPIRRKLRLIHYPDSFDVSSSDIECLIQGKQYVIK